MERKRLNRSTTGDRGPPGGNAIIHTVEQLGPNRHRLPSGALLCKNVPLARTGWMMYGPGETPITVGDSGLAYVERTEDTLFCDKCVASFMGAPVTDEHPGVDVTPENWKQYARGYVVASWRGTGDNADLIMGDILVTDAALIRSILAGKREVSAGYDADYEQVKDGVGRQTNIITNHIALVEKGRCGPRCAIGDHGISTHSKGMAMPTTKRRAVLDKLHEAVDAVATLDADEADEGGGATHIHIHPNSQDEGDGPEGKGAAGKTEDPYEARFAGIETSLKTIGEAFKNLGKKKTGDAASDPDDEDGDDDDAATAATGDSKALEVSYGTVLARAEVLVPGFNMPTFDGKLTRKATVDRMCTARRKALDICNSTKDGAALIASIGDGDLDLATMDCASVAMLFNATAAAKAAINNAGKTADADKDKDKNVVPLHKVPTLAEINKRNQEFWDKQPVRA